jgi:hypothetical protein
MIPSLSQWLTDMRAYKKHQKQIQDEDAAAIDLILEFEDPGPEEDDPEDDPIFLDSVEFERTLDGLAHEWNGVIYDFVTRMREFAREAIDAQTIVRVRFLGCTILYTTKPWITLLENVEQFSVDLAKFSGAPLEDTESLALEFLSHVDMCIENYMELEVDASEVSEETIRRVVRAAITAIDRSGQRFLIYDEDMREGPDVYKDWERRQLAAMTIQKTWRWCVSDPEHPVCRRRIRNEFALLVPEA